MTCVVSSVRRSTLSRSLSFISPKRYRTAAARKTKTREVSVHSTIFGGTERPEALCWVQLAFMFTVRVQENCGARRERWTFPLHLVSPASVGVNGICFVLHHARKYGNNYEYNMSIYGWDPVSSRGAECARRAMCAVISFQSGLKCSALLEKQQV
jgi:hypothetical protein